MKKYYLYKVTNTINQKYYIGVHKAKDPHDSYLGSGPYLKKAISLHGIENFKKEIIFETLDKHEAYEKEKELVKTNLQDPLSYNLKSGGIGGWEWYNEQGFPNSMHNPETAEKVSKSLKQKYQDDVNYRKTLNESAKKANAASVLVTKGKKRPEHSLFIKEMFKDGKFKNFKKPGGRFEVYSPNGDTFVVDSLTEFCNNNNLPFVSVWKTSKTEGCINKKGKAKGWTCKKI